MKILILALMFISISLSGYSQNNELQGLEDQNNNLFFEWAGYNFNVEKIKAPKNENDISKLKKKLKIDKKYIQRDYSTSEINRPNRIIIAQKEFERAGQKYSDITQSGLFYIIEKDDKYADLISISRLGERDLDIENKFISYYLSDSLSYFIGAVDVDSINFVGRTIYLGNLCNWKSPNNIYCKGAQISWSVFRSYEKAKDENDLIILLNDSKLNLILDDTNIDVLFEGYPVKARRIIYKSLNGGYPLAVYYIVAEIRGYYVSCVLSHYVYNKNDYELPDLLKEVMDFEKIPESSINKYTNPQLDELTSEQKIQVEEKIKDIKYRNYIFNFKSGLYLPLGGQQNLLLNGTYINFAMHFGKWMSIDSYSNNMFDESPSSFFFDFDFVIPNKRKEFKYYESGEILNAKANCIVGMNLGYLYKTKLKRNIYWENYMKIGLSGILTNQKNKEKNKANYEATVFSASLGTNIRYKRVGLFLDYRFSPYNQSKHLDTGGNSALIIGLNVIL